MFYKSRHACEVNLEREWLPSAIEKAATLEKSTAIESCAWKQRLQAKGERNSGSENKEK